MFRSLLLLPGFCARRDCFLIWDVFFVYDFMYGLALPSVDVMISHAVDPAPCNDHFP